MASLFSPACASDWEQVSELTSEPDFSNAMKHRAKNVVAVVRLAPASHKSVLSIDPDGGFPGRLNQCMWLRLKSESYVKNLSTMQ